MRHLRRPTRLLATALATGLSVVVLASAPSYADHRAPAQTCHGLRATIVGTPGVDNLQGTPGPDVIVGLAGNDLIDGNGGDDVICGNKGADRLYGGDGNDWLEGGLAHDDLRGGDGDDVMKGGDKHGNMFYADAGDDTWISQGISDARTRSGMVTEDEFNYTNAPAGVTVDLPAGTATGDGIGHDTLQLTEPTHGFTVLGSSHDDTITTTAGPDQIADYGGAATIDSGGGNDYITHIALDNPTGTVIDAGTGNDRVDESGDAEVTIQGGPGNDSINGTGGAYFGAGTIDGGDGNDYISASLSFGDARTLIGGSGDDTLGLTLVGGQPGGWGTTTVDLGAEAISDSVGDSHPLDGFESVQVDDRNAPASEPASDYVIRETDGDNFLDFYAEDDGNDTPAEVYGLGGDDTLITWAGDDLLNGGPGHDLGRGYAGKDTCVSIEGPAAAGVPTCEVTRP